jgi:hypothetical protein
VLVVEEVSPGVAYWAHVIRKDEGPGDAPTLIPLHEELELRARDSARLGNDLCDAITAEGWTGVGVNAAYKPVTAVTPDPRNHAVFRMSTWG